MYQERYNLRLRKEKAMRQIIWVAAIIAALVVGYFGGNALLGGETDANLKNTVSALEQRVKSLEAQVAGLGEIDSLKKRVSDLEGGAKGTIKDLEELKSRIDELAKAIGLGGLKLAYLDADKVFVEYKGTQPAVEKFSKEKEKIEKDLQQLQQQWQAGQISQREYLEKLQKGQADLQKLDLELTAEIQKKMIEVIEEVGKEKGYDWIMVRKSIVLYQKEGLMDDITAEVLKRMNEKYEAGEK